jgi:hypothetical protein
VLPALVLCQLVTTHPSVGDGFRRGGRLWATALGLRWSKFCWAAYSLFSAASPDNTKAAREGRRNTREKQQLQSPYQIFSNLAEISIRFMFKEVRMGTGRKKMLEGVHGTARLPACCWAWAAQQCHASAGVGAARVRVRAWARPWAWAWVLFADLQECIASHSSASDELDSLWSTESS